LPNHWGIATEAMDIEQIAAAEMKSRGIEVDDA
jgi:hypothetical protein